MSDPSTVAALISGIVSAFTAYVGYRTSVDTAKDKGEPAPAKSEEAARGEQVAQVVETSIQRYGQGDAEMALAGFQQNPQLFAPVLQQVLIQLAERSPAFLQQLQKLANQGGTQPNVTGTATVTESAKVYGTVAGVITGNVTGGTYTITDNDDDAPNKRKE